MNRCVCFSPMSKKSTKKNKVPTGNGTEVSAFTARSEETKQRPGGTGGSTEAPTAAPSAPTRQQNIQDFIVQGLKQAAKKKDPEVCTGTRFHSCHCCP